MSYYFQFQPAKKILSTFLTGKTFSIELGDVNMVEGDWTVLCRKNKFLSFDIKRNKYLK